MAHYKLVLKRDGLDTEFTVSIKFKTEIDAIYFYNDYIHKVGEPCLFERVYQTRTKLKIDWLEFILLWCLFSVVLEIATTIKGSL